MTSVLVQFGKFSEHVERIKIERRNDRMRGRIVFDEVHRIEVDGRMVRMLHVRVLLQRVVGVTSEAVGAVLQVTLHLVVAVQVEKSEKSQKQNDILINGKQVLTL